MTNVLLYYLIVINIVTFLVYGIDKWKAKQGSWRISEELTRNSYEIVKAKYAGKRGQNQTHLSHAEREHTRPKVKYTKK